MTRIIAHIDMNSFYASVEEKYNPTLKGKPLAISGEVRERHGIIVTANYPARKFGIKATMRVSEAKRLCPDIKFMKPNFERYQEQSKLVFDLIRTYTPNVEVVSIDEAYVDLTDIHEPIKTMAIIQRRIYYELDLPSSVGISYNKFFAKMGSDLNKPKGFTIINKKNYKEVLWDLDISEMHGCGKSSATKLKKQGIKTIGELAVSNEVILNSLLGTQGLRLKQRANGNDNRKLKYSVDRKSIGNSKTYPKDLEDDLELQSEIKKLSIKVSNRAVNRNYVGNNISITIKFNDFKTITRSKKLSNYINDSDNIFNNAWELLTENYNFDKGVRLLGVSLNDIIKSNNKNQQIDIFTSLDEKFLEEVKIKKLLKYINNKYGKEVVKQLKNDKDTKKNIITTSFSKDFLDD